MLNEFDEFGRKVEYRSNGRKIEYTENGHKIYEYLVSVEDWDNARTVTTEGGGMTTTSIPIVTKWVKYYLKPWEFSKYDGPRQAHITEFCNN